VKLTLSNYVDINSEVARRILRDARALVEVPIQFELGSRSQVEWYVASELPKLHKRVVRLGTEMERTNHIIKALNDILREGKTQDQLQNQLTESLRELFTAVEVRDWKPAWADAHRLLMDEVNNEITPLLDDLRLAFASHNTPVVQERHDLQVQVAYRHPYLKPIGAELIADGLPKRLREDALEQRIWLRNIGETTPTEVYAVFFPSEHYVVPNTMPQQVIYGLHGVYWHGTLDVPPAPKENALIILKRATFPLQGKDQFIKGQYLFAPPEPPWRSAVAEPFYCGRLTLTCRDLAGAILAQAFDMDAATDDWLPVIHLREVGIDLREMTQEAVRMKKPQQ